jgi:hypothetical protein
VEKAENIMDRVIRDGRVAVIFSPGYGSGWYTSHDIEALIFDSSIVAWIEAEEYDKIKNYMILKYPDTWFGALEDLRIAWIPEGTEFVIDEYDGNESILFKDKVSWIKA